VAPYLLLRKAISREAISMIVMEGEEFLTAQEACAILGVKPATLYAYVSRGFLGSFRQGIKRQRLYRREEVERLIRLRGSHSEWDADPTGKHETTETDTPDDPARDGRAWIPYV
jgi:excisionase family DNA binding protein